MRLGTPLRTASLRAFWPEHPRDHLKWLIWIAVAGYFVYHLANGHDGLLAGYELSRQVATLEEEYADLTDQRQRMEHRVFLLRPDSLDPDLLDEQARRSIGFADPSEMVIFHPSPE